MIITNQEVYLNGDKITDWACDVNPETGEHEPNGGIENLIKYKSKLYLVISSWDGGTIHRADSRAKKVNKLNIDPQDSVLFSVIDNW